MVWSFRCTTVGAPSGPYTTSAARAAVAESATKTIAEKRERISRCSWGRRCEEGGGERALAQFPWEPEQKRARRVQYQATVPVPVPAPVWPREPLSDRGPHHDQVVLVPRDTARDEQQIVLRNHVHDRQVLDRAPVNSHLPRHALVLEYAPWRLALTDRAGVAMQLVRGGA